jgi:MoaA/NifB/PqqE/SkfB family radical SAM enzyme
MTLDDFKTIIDQVKHHANQVALGGRGDPNLHPQFREIVEYARSNNVVPNYTTSGINMTDEHIEISKQCGAVAVSDYNRHFTFDALNRLMDAGIKTNIHLIFSRDSYSKSMDIVKGIDVWNGKIDLEKLNAVILLLFKPQGSGADKQWMIPSKAQIAAFSLYAFRPKAKFKIGMDSCLINHVLTYAKPNEIQRMAIDTCESSRMSVYISPSMKLIPCSFVDHEEWGVQIDEANTIYNIWNNSESFKKFRNRLMMVPNSCPVGL